MQKMQYLSRHQRLRLSEEGSRSQLSAHLPACLHRGLHPREAGTYLEVLEEVLMLGPSSQGVSNQPLLLAPLGLAGAPSGIFSGFWGPATCGLARSAIHSEGCGEQALASRCCALAGECRAMPLGRKQVAHGLEKEAPASPSPPAPPTAAWSNPTPGCSGLWGAGASDAPEEDLAFPQASEGK